MRTTAARRLALPALLAASAIAGGLALPEPLRAQETEHRIRLGVVLGGTGFLALVTEYEREGWGAEIAVGTIGFQDISVALTGKRYFTEGRARPLIGLGLWSHSAWTEDGSGSILIARFPLGVDWAVSGEHALGVEVALNRALAVDRLDPEDDTPPNRSLIPLPGFYYRHGWRP